MDFFEALGERAKARLGSPEKWEGQGIVGQQVYEAGKVGVDATIEALKEMMVEPKKTRRGYLAHTTFKATGQKWTRIYFRFAEATDEGHHGIDGEEVVVMVFKHGKAS